MSWGAGMDWGDALIHPSIELDFNLGGGLTFYVNTWCGCEQISLKRRSAPTFKKST